ncbi:MAG: hypothetical protein CSB44_07330 [Gammaproteobacteria bacterium]|nr:MAG: hypothetical protein CSB44_07330 [Gammaproteobacteria bacterium]
MKKTPEGAGCGPKGRRRNPPQGIHKRRGCYHHGNLADSLLDAVDEMATRFGLEAVTLRGCAKITGVSPSSAFRHYADKRALLTAFATRALNELGETMHVAAREAEASSDDAFTAVALAYVRFALVKPALFRAMWKEESIYSHDADYVAAARELSCFLTSGFADTLHDDDPMSFSDEELLAWSAVHGLASLMIDGPIAGEGDIELQLNRARGMIAALGTNLSARPTHPDDKRKP